MKILSIETSCDETSVAIAEFSGPKLHPRFRARSHIVLSQIPVHKKFGGVVPNLAKREHQKNLAPILLQALQEAGFSISKSQFPISKQIPNLKSQTIEKILERELELAKHFKKRILPLKPPAIDAIAVTHGPGLAPALWVGVNFARALAYIWKRPLIPVNHMAGHLYSALIQKSEQRISKSQFPISKLPNHFGFRISDFNFPAIALLVSGGHTELVLTLGHGKFKVLGETLDDAAGEAFDKVARLLALGYPGGPAISRLARKGNPSAFDFPRPMLHAGNFDFSFSGLKTAVLYHMRDNPGSKKTDVAASFEKAAVDVLVQKTIRAARTYKAKTVLLGGGVSANRLLRSTLENTLKKELPNTTCVMPDISLTGDNALMIAVAAYYAGTKKALDKVGADANLRLGA